MNGTGKAAGCPNSRSVSIVVASIVQPEVDYHCEADGGSEEAEIGGEAPSRRRGLAPWPKWVQVQEGWMSPAIRTAVETVTVTAGLAGFEALAEAVYEVGDRHGVGPVPDTRVADSVAGERAAGDGVGEGVDAAWFGADAVNGEVGQALADRAGNGHQASTGPSGHAGQDVAHAVEAPQAPGVAR